MTTRVELTLRWALGFPTSTAATEIAKHVAGIGSDGPLELVVNGEGFTVYYDEKPAVGDNGQPVRGDVTGDFEVFRGVDGPVGLKRLGDVHVSPHGSSGYGNPHAKPYACDEVGRIIANAVGRLTP